jgi:hypothetical protein
VRAWWIILAACGSASPRSSPAPVAAAAPAPCVHHHVHGTIRDAADKPVGRLVLDVVGDDGRDSARTDDDGRFDLHSAQPHARLVVHYGDSDVTRVLSTAICDEQIDLRVTATATEPLVM